MKAVILAGGKGTRLGTLAHDIPKPMVHIGGKPILEHQIELGKSCGINDYLLITGHLSGVIENHFKNGKKFGVNISYFMETVPLGTTGGIKACREQLHETFFVFYGDVMMNLDLNAMLAFHSAQKGMATLAVHPNDHPFDSDLLDIDDEHRIISFFPKPHSGAYYRNLVNAALYILEPQIFNYLPEGKKADFGKDIFPAVYKKEKIFAWNTPEYIKDVGTPERLSEVSADLESGKTAMLNRQNPRPAVFLDRDGVINEYRGLVSRPDDFILYPFAARAIKKLEQAGFLCIIISNQPAVARGLCSIDDIRSIHKKMEWQLGLEQAKLDAVYFCPHHPDRGYPEENPDYKISCSCRKPDIGMIKQACLDFNIDLKKSYFIGDSARDMKCGKRAGLLNIAVETGENTAAREDCFSICTNLEEAAGLICSVFKK
ncbi:MAG: hypothetical protein A2096_00315 [Spirochaetes bacterium GWF1_41_5]|nr:MAG: hypothetical protein A2096_00315 [Spirochaetes bacterium GWF1_41_5]HBE01219.1 D,D-heptose 1,7-bisphosphate phosphatase [Spirochaetia bacterium]